MVKWLYAQGFQLLAVNQNYLRKFSISQQVQGICTIDPWTTLGLWVWTPTQSKIQVWFYSQHFVSMFPHLHIQSTPDWVVLHDTCIRTVQTHVVQGSTELLRNATSDSDIQPGYKIVILCYLVNRTKMEISRSIYIFIVTYLNFIPP